MTDLATTTIALGTGPVLGTRDSDGTIWRTNQDGFTGWGEPASSLAPIRKPRQQGSSFGESFNADRIMTVAGTITALTPALLNSAIVALITAVSNAQFIMTVTESGMATWVAARKQGETLTTKVTNLIANYSIQVVSLDSRKFGTQLSGSTHLSVSSGGLMIPFTIPVAISSTVVSSQVALTNPGNTIGPVTIRIDGPTSQPIITHRGPSGVPLVYSSSLVLAAGEWLIVDMDARTALANGQSSRAGYTTSRGWFGFDPGVNVFSFASPVYNAGSLMTVFATPAWK